MIPGPLRHRLPGPLRHRLPGPLRRRLPVASALLTVVILLVTALVLDGGAPRPAAAASSGPPVVDQPVIGLPASGVVAFGASPAEASGEAWAYGQVGSTPVTTTGGTTVSDGPVLLQRAADGTWQPLALPSGAGGGGGTGPTANPKAYGADAGQATPQGSVVLLDGQQIVLRAPGGRPTLVPTPGTISGTGSGATGVLGSGESLVDPTPGAAITIPYAVVDEPGANAGVLIAPYDDGQGTGGQGPGVLDYDGQTGQWTREPIEGPAAGQSGFTPLAIGCGPTAAAPQTVSPSNCWLLAQSGSAGSAGTLGLYTRDTTGNGPQWNPVDVDDWLLGSAAPPSGVTTATASALPAGAQMLTVTAQGAWVDMAATIDGEQTDVSELVTATGPDAAAVDGRWCSPTTDGCPQSLGAALPTSYRSFAWPGASASDPGTRVITGLPDRGLLTLTGGRFGVTTGPGGATGPAAGGGAFASATEGWLADGSPTAGTGLGDDEGSPQMVDVTTSPTPDALTSVPIGLTGPLLSVASAPGSTAGDGATPAIAVGADGEVARYTPGAGWSRELLLQAGTDPPTLRGVAWPTAGQAFAVGDGGAIFDWTQSSGGWYPDPGVPSGTTADLNGVAFPAGSAEGGYAVGESGTLLQDTGSGWTQVALPGALAGVDFTSVAFAGSTALATFQSGTGSAVTGGLAVDTGSGWSVDTGAAQALGGVIPTRVAGLADGGAVAAGPGEVIETGDAGADSWTPSPDPLPVAQNIAALAAFRDSSDQIQALVSVDLDANLAPGAASASDALPASGYLLAQTSDGWSDLEHATWPATGTGDGPQRPDPVLALSVSPDGSEGLAVGGQTGDFSGSSLQTGAQTASVMTFGSGAAETGGADTSASVSLGSQANFVFAGGAECLAACAGEGNEGLTPDTSLQNAIAGAAQLPGIQAFLYAGGHDVPSAASGLSDSERQAELTAEAGLLGAGSLPVLAAPASDALSPTSGMGLFDQTVGQIDNSSGQDYYSYRSSGTGGPVQVIVLDFSSGALDATQRGWLIAQLAAAQAAGVPAIVMGDDALGFPVPSTSTTQPVPQASDGADVAQILNADGASAYLFEDPGANVELELPGDAHIPAIGTGTLGYVEPSAASDPDAALLPGNGDLVVSVDTAHRNPATDVAPVWATGNPNLGSLAIDAQDGTTLRVGELAEFGAIARRVAGGMGFVDAGGSDSFVGPAPTDTLASDCESDACDDWVPSQFQFTSATPGVGQFIWNTNLVPPSSSPIQIDAGTFCASTPGTTDVTLQAGGMSVTVPVTVVGSASGGASTCGLQPAKAATTATTATTTTPTTSTTTPAPPATTTATTPVTPPPTHPTPGHPPVHRHHPAPPVTRHHPVAHHHPVHRRPPPSRPLHHPVVPHRPPPAPPAASHALPPAQAQSPPPPNLPHPAAHAPAPSPSASSAPTPASSPTPAQAPTPQSAAARERSRVRSPAVQQVHQAVIVRSPGGPLPIPAWTAGLILLGTAGSLSSLSARRRARSTPAFSPVRRRRRPE